MILGACMYIEPLTVVVLDVDCSILEYYVNIFM
jgi:hypothetical protein